MLPLSTSLLLTAKGPVQHGTNHARVLLYATTKAEDGEELFLYRSFDAHFLEGLPSDHEIELAIKEIVELLMKLCEAPFVEAYTGPAILSGKAGGVYFHETPGHRLEGHRQKDEDGGQTFTKKVGEKILPSFISIHDDPTIVDIDGIDLNGHYLFDDEGIRATRLPVVENGVLKNFLMSRSPVKGFTQSNGHGRGFLDPGTSVGTLFVETSELKSEDEIKREFLEACRDLGLEYGSMLREVKSSSSRSMLGGGISISFRGDDDPTTEAYKVYVEDDREELVRNVEIDEVNLRTLEDIMGAGGKKSVLNTETTPKGTIGFSSVPISIVSPSLLLEEVQINPSTAAQQKPALLTHPYYD